MKVKVVLIGASKRYDSVQLLKASATSLNIELELFSVEYRAGDLHPISELANVIEGPAFEDPAFIQLMVKLCSIQNPTLFVPFMDSAAVSLSKIQQTSKGIFLVSKRAESISNKITMKNLALDFGVPIVPNTEGVWPKIMKPANGFGSRGIRLINNISNSREILSSESEYILEDFIEGDETSVDAYFSKSNQLHSVIARDRLLIEGGEVIHTRTRDLDSWELNALSKFGRFGLTGPVNFQFISRGPLKFLMEINPRFGGGSTASMRAGWNAWGWILEEYLLQRPLSKPTIKHLELFRTRRDHWRYL